VTSRQSAGETDKLVRRYLAQLDAALRGVDASRREEILADVHEHIEEGRAGLDPDDAASVRTLLDRVGDPTAIAAEAGASLPGSRRWDAWAPWLIIFGFIASGLGWIAGVLILWTSPTWSRRDQLIATFVPLAGLVALFFGLVAAFRAAAGCPGSASCTTKGVTLPLGVAILLVVVGLAAHLLPPIHLMRTRRQQRSTLA
jgi:HAAS domain-containing protein